MSKKNKLILGILIVVCIIISVIGVLISKENLMVISYKEFKDEVQKDNIETVIIQENKIEFKKKNDELMYETFNPNSNTLMEELLLKGINVETNNTTETIAFVFDALFYLIFFGMVGFGVYKFNSFTGNSFKVVSKTNVKFDDIAGMDDLKREMKKAVEILKNQDEYVKKGIRPIKGIILEGNPGNGKTLFAKALATETDVKFIATKGADFQSAMMSMGARKIKMLFKKAKKCKPCIIFIDEFDGIGEKRNYAGTGVDKENNRIITAMLNEMDGFDTQSGILVIAATNSYTSLDPALIRPGRFDLKYNVPNPDYETRLKLIDLYTKNKKLDEIIKKENLAECFEHYSCSGIEAVLNEASMLAELHGQEKISQDNIIQAVSKTGLTINMKKFLK